MEEIEEIKRYKTCELVNELNTRNAVQTIDVIPYKEIQIYVDSKKQNLEINQGPAKILIVWD